MRLKPRVDALERCNPEWKPWHRLIVDVGETEDEAIARYEAEHGPIGDDHRLIVRIVEAPQRKEPCA